MERFLKIDEMYAFISVDEEGEGICGFNGPDGWLPLVGADMDRVSSLMGIAQNIADLMGKQIKIVKFSTREQIGEINPT